jgi:hypothetical protein
MKNTRFLSSSLSQNTLFESLFVENVGFQRQIFFSNICLVYHLVCIDLKIVVGFFGSVIDADKLCAFSNH